MLSPEEENEIDLRGIRNQAKRAPKKPNMVRPEDIQDELLGEFIWMKDCYKALC